MKSKTKSTAILVTSNGMSNAESELRTTLLSNYFKLLIEEEFYPNAILFYGEGVKTIAEGSAFVEVLQKLEEKGVNLIICKTCLNFYGLIDKVKIGKIGTMADIVHYQWNVDKVITI
jgi:intracellular sulfur oxidation DsrE/DsrF family protein